MVVGEKDRVDRWEGVDRQPRIHDPSRTHPLSWKRSLAEDRVGKHVDAAELKEHGGMPNPGNREIGVSGSGI
jgi:hypothetical protein